MKVRLFSVFLSISVLLLLADLVHAQQGVDGGGLSPSPWGQSQSPYVGVPPYSPMRPMAPQGYYAPSRGPLGGSYYPYPPPLGKPIISRGDSGLSESRRRRCDLVTSVPPPLLPPIAAPGSTQAISAHSPLTAIPLGRSKDQLIRIGLIGESGKQPGEIANPKEQKDGTSQSTNEVGNRIPRSANHPDSSPFFYESISPIEAAFRQVPIFGQDYSQNLRQYGYSLFAAPISTFAPVEDVPVGPDYILGPGDNLMVNIWGSMEGGISLTVDRNGEIMLPSAGPIRVWGLAYSEADRIIQQQLSKYYRGFKASVTMGRLRTIMVYVVGEVCQPGAFTLSSLSTVTNALFAAGGPLKLGSLRNIELKRNHRTVGSIDLYDFLLRGDKTRDFRLQSGDTIFVPPVGPTVALGGEVKRPAIYELRGEAYINDLIEMAGGLTPRSYLKRVQVIRAKPNAEREIMDLDLTLARRNGNESGDTRLQDGDFIRIPATDPRIYNTVRLEGAVKYSGEYELKEKMRLSDLLKKENMLPEAYADRVEIARLNDDLTTEIVSVDLKKAWQGDKSQDILLKRRDLISVRSDYKIPGSVKLEGEIVRPGIYRIQRGEHLSSVLKRAGGYTANAFLKGAVFTRRSVEVIERKRLEDFIHQQEEVLLADTNQKNLLPQRREQLLLLASKVTLGRVVIQLDEMDKFEGSINDIVFEDGDTLKIPEKPATVLVLGSVRNPTGVLHQEGRDIQYYLNRAGGLSPHAAKKEIYLLKADGSAIAGFMRLRDIEPGDVIIAPPDTTVKVDKLALTKALATIAGQIALSFAGLVAIF